MRVLREFFKAKCCHKFAIASRCRIMIVRLTQNLSVCNCFEIKPVFKVELCLPDIGKIFVQHFKSISIKIVRNMKKSRT